MTLHPLKLLSSMATRELLEALAVQYAQSSGRPVSAEAAGGVDVAKRIEAGESADVVVLSSSAIDKLIAADRLLAGSRVDLVRSGVSVAVLSARTLSYSTGPSGVYLEKLFARWGILDSIRERIIVPRPGIPVGSLVASGEAELGFQQLSELMSLHGVDVVGPLPPAIQTMTIFSGGICSRSADPAAARALLAFLASPATADMKTRHGMEAAG